MRAVFSSLIHRLGAADLVARHGYGRLALIAVPHIIALAIMLATEARPVEIAAFLLAWGILNFFWLALTRRPAVAGALSLVMMTVLVLLSDLKYHVLMMTANFVDLMIIDTDTVSFLFTIYPALRWIVLLCVVALVPLVAFTWRADPFRVRRLTAMAALLACVGGLTAVGDAPADAAVRGVLWRQPGVVLRPLRRRCDLGTAHARPHGIRCLRRRPPAAGERRDLYAGEEAAAHYSHSRRVEF